MTATRLLLGSCLLACFLTAPAQRRDAHNYDLENVSWHISYDQSAGTIRGEVTNSLSLTGDGSNYVSFDCGPLTIERVTVDGLQTRVTREGEKLTVTLPRAGRKGQKLNVRVEYSGSPTAGIYFVSAEHAYPAKSGMVYTQGEAEDTRYWLPTYDFPDDKATAEGFIKVPAGQFALSNGKLLDVQKGASTWTYHWRIAEPISTYLISFVAGDYSEGRESVGKLPVLWYVPRGTETWGAAAFAGTNHIIDTYNRLTGFNYAFEKFSQSAVADFMFGGMENASCVTQTINTLHKPENEPIANSQGLVAHELAHQWFGDTVTCMDWSHAWLNEGFASFLPAFWFRQARGQDACDVARYDLFLGAIGSQMATRRPVVSNKYEVPMDLFDGQIYGGGAARLFTLMNQLGEKTFWQGVKAYLNQYKFKNATTEDFFAVMSRVSKRDLSAFRQQFFYSSTAPAFSVSRRGSDVVIRQPAPGVDLDLKLSFLSRDAIDKQLPVQIHGAETVVPAPGLESDLVVLDYPVTAMANINYETPVTSADLLRIWRLAPNAAAKLSVLGRFGNRVSEDDLLEVARSEKSPVVLQRLISRLNKNSVPFLVQVSRSFDRETALSAVQRLAAFLDEPAAVDRLRDVWSHDRNEFMRNTALQALLKLSKDDGLAEQAWAQESQFDMYRVTVLNWWAEKNKDRARKTSLEVLGGPPDEPLKNAAIRILGTLKDAPGEHRVFETLMHVARDPGYGAKMAAVSALVSYGDPAAISVIEPLTKHSLFFTRRAAEGAIAALRAK